MTLPAPRAAVDDRFIDPRRDLWMAAAAKLWDDGRAQTKSQLTHVSEMIRTSLGGTVVIEIASKVDGLPEANVFFQSEGFPGLAR